MQVNANSMMAHSSWMNANANNIANVNSENFNASNTSIQNSNDSLKAVFVSTSSGTNLAKDMVEQIPIAGGFNAQLAAIKTQEQMIGSLLNIKA